MKRRQRGFIGPLVAWRRWLPVLLVLALSGAGIYVLWWNASRIAETLPVESLSRERDFSALLLDVTQLEAALGLAVESPTPARLERLRLANDVVYVRLGDNEALYGGLREPAAQQLFRDLRALVDRLDTGLRAVEPVMPDSLWTQARTVRDALRALNDRTYQTSMAQASAEQEFLGHLKSDMSVVLVLLGLGGLALATMLLRQGRGLAALRLAQDALQASEARYRELVDNANVIILRLDMDGTLAYFNEYAERFFGYPAAEILGKPALGTIVPAREAQGGRDLEAMLAAILADPEAYAENENENLTRDGRRVYVHWTNRMLRDEHGRPTGILAVGHDITARKRMEAAEARQRATLRLLNEVAANSGLTLNEQLHQGLAICAGHLGLEFGIVSQISGDEYRVLAQVSPPGTLSDGMVFPFAHTYCHITLSLEKGGVLAIPHMGRSPYLGHPCYREFRLEAYIGAPIQVEGQVLGTVNFSSAQPYSREFDDGDKEFVALLARWIGSAMERERAGRRLAESELRLQAIIDTEPECVKLLDRDGALLRMNPAGLAMLEVADEAEVLGTSLSGFVLPAYRLAYDAMVPRVFAGESVALEYELEGRKGGRRWLESRAVPLRDAQGGIVALLAVTRDISERKRAEAALLAAKREAEAASHAKSAFLATMSHEIRTPLNGVLGMAQLLMEDEVGEADRRDWARTIFNSGQTLLTLLNDILDLSKVEAGRVELERMPLSPAQLVRETVALFAEAAHQKGLDLRVEACDDAGRRVWGDPYRLRQILSNLINNAIKFTDLGSVSVRLEAVGTERWRFRVSDTGIGITATQRDKLFQAFSQLDGSITRRYGGTGLGLAIVRGLVELMGGELGVESTPNRGSEFWFEVPLEGLPASQDSRAVSRDAGAVPPAAPAGREVLVAEDILTNQRIIQIMLEKLGYRPTIVGNGRQLLDALEQGRYDLVLMDCQMPVMDGFEATRRLRAREQESGGRRLPVVALTAGAFESDRERCLLCGMDDFLTKPVSKDELDATLRRWLEAGS